MTCHCQNKWHIKSIETEKTRKDIDVKVKVPIPSETLHEE